MKSKQNFLESLSVGQRVSGVVEFALGPDMILVNFKGNLVSVENHSIDVFREGQQVELIVDAIDPVRLRMARSLRDGSLNLNA